MARYDDGYEYEIYQRQKNYQSNKGLIVVPAFLIIMFILFTFGTKIFGG